MQNHDFFLKLGSLFLLAGFGFGYREGLDSRDIAVSDKIVAAKEVKISLHRQHNFFTQMLMFTKVRVFDKSWLHVGLIMSNYELTERWEHNQCQLKITKIFIIRKEKDITVELQVVGILDRGGGKVVCDSLKLKYIELLTFDNSSQVRNETKLSNYFKRLVTSVLLHSTGTPVHLIIVTESESLEPIRRDLKNRIGQHLSSSLIRRPTPDIVDFVYKFPK